MKYTLEQLKQFLLEPSFDIEAYLNADMTGKGIINILEQAIKHHANLDNNIIDGERQ
jgi:hypothetical protein